MRLARFFACVAVLAGCGTQNNGPSLIPPPLASTGGANGSAGASGDSGASPQDEVVLPAPARPWLTPVERLPAVDGCGKMERYDGTHTTTVAGKPREYLVQLPPNYDPNQRYPVVFGLHGAGGNGPSFAS